MTQIREQAGDNSTVMNRRCLQTRSSLCGVSSLCRGHCDRLALFPEKQEVKSTQDMIVWPHASGLENEVLMGIRYPRLVI